MKIPTLDPIADSAVKINSPLTEEEDEYFCAQVGGVIIQLPDDPLN